MENRDPEKEWQERAKAVLKAELKRRSLTYQGLVDRLAEAGIRETAQNVTNKISRGGFSAAFLLQCLVVIGCRRLDLDFED